MQHKDHAHNDALSKLDAWQMSISVEVSCAEEVMTA